MRLTRAALGLALVLASLPTGLAAAEPAPTPSPAAAPAAPQAKKSLELRVVDANTQQPLPEGVVELEADWGGDDVKLKPGADGRVRVEYPADTKYLSVAAKADKAKYVPMRVSWGAGRSPERVPAEYTLALEPGTTIGGKVVDDEGKPVAGATVVLHVRKKMPRPNERVDVAFIPVTTAADGTWSFDRAPAEFDSISVGTYHLKYATAAWYPMQEFKPAAVRDGTASLTLQRGVPVEGVVYGPDGKPLPGATVGVGSDRVASNSTPEFKTDDKGRFSFAAKPGELAVVTVKARGHAPDQRQFLAGDLGKKHDLEFRLQPAKVMRGRIVDGSGKPVPDVSIFTDTWRGSRALCERLKTDADGRFTWDSAPADAVLLDIYKLGYADLRRAPATATDRELVFTLRKPLKVRGEVVDAETGKPVESFTVVPGIAFNDERISWQRREMEGPDAVKPRPGGTFEFDRSYPYPGYAVRIEAAGYLPADSRVFKMDEGEVALKFELKKGKGLSGIVRTPDGKPAAGAKIVVATPTQSAYIINGEKVHDQGCVTTVAGPAGQYDLPPQTGAYTLVVIHDAGYAEATAEQLAASQDVTLAAWGKVEGTVMIGAKPGVATDVRVHHSGERYDSKAPRIHHQIETKANWEGKLTFARVQPGEVFVSRTVSIPWAAAVG